MTDKPTTKLLPTAMMILQTKGEDAVQRWYNARSEEQRAAYHAELFALAENINGNFREIGEIIQRQREAMVAALRPFGDALRNMNK